MSVHADSVVMSILIALHFPCAPEGEEEIHCAPGSPEPLRGTCVTDCMTAGMNRMAGLVLDPNNETGACWRKNELCSVTEYVR